MNIRPVLIVTLLLLAGCREPGGPQEVERVATVKISPSTQSLSVGETMELSAVVYGESGAVLSGRMVHWSSDDESRATVTSDGIVTGRAVGMVSIRAEVGGRAAEIGIVVQPVPVATVEIVTGSNFEQEVGTTLPLQVRARAADGTELTGRTVHWFSSSDTVAYVDSTGMLHALAGGSTIVTAAIEGKTASARVRVFAVVASVIAFPASTGIGIGDVARITAATLGRDGIVLNRAITWTSSDSAVARVSGSGRVTGNAPGIATITAASQGRSANVSVVVGSWHERSLRRIDDMALPATLYTATWLIDGVQRAVRYEVPSGVYREMSEADRYEIRLDGWLYVAGRDVQRMIDIVRGVIVRDPVTAATTLVPDVLEPGIERPQYRGRVLSDGSLVLTGTPEGGSVDVTLLFR